MKTLCLRDFFVHYLKKSMCYPVSLIFLIHLLVYSPIPQSAEWKFSLGFESTTWKNSDFNASSWENKTLGSSTTVGAGSQYLRYSFTGSNSLAVVELALKYQYGIAAYINGVEIYRDNLGDGVISHDQLASGSYSTCDYHYILRQASIAPASSLVLAVEIHFTSQVTTPVFDFNCWMAMYAPSLPNSGMSIIL